MLHNTSCHPLNPTEVQHHHPPRPSRKFRIRWRKHWLIYRILGTISFAVLEECTDQFNELSSQAGPTQEELKAFSQEIDHHNRNEDTVFNGIKANLADDIKQQVSASMRSKSADWIVLIRGEVARQVKGQVDEQIREHLPESLQQQADESRRQLEGIKVSLQNSESRMTNSFIQSTNLEDPLAPILTAEGKKSSYYPANTRCLFGYDLESAKGLSKDYELTDTDDLFMNFQQFLKHIGGWQAGKRRYPCPKSC
ncbi:hypothetical protein BDZ97DRAFT_482399 [Flammula alnicola]|nr:hypothetical protein BDZ97DRAFT_482399 [Flammula alnicola]